jgi:fatty-acyl-CoA synthase
MKHDWSYTGGTSEKPLFGMTIGDMFDEMAARYADNEALVVCHQKRRKKKWRELKP